MLFFLLQAFENWKWEAFTIGFSVSRLFGAFPTRSKEEDEEEEEGDDYVPSRKCYLS